jgi:hypothetical protein
MDILNTPFALVVLGICLWLAGVLLISMTMLLVKRRSARTTRRSSQRQREIREICQEARFTLDELSACYLRDVQNLEQRRRR